MDGHQTAPYQDWVPDHHSEKNFHPHVNGSDMSGFGHRQWTKVCPSLNTDATKTPVNAFITSRADYWNSVFNGTGAVNFRPMQSVLNASARLIVKKRKYDQISATNRDELHWLPVQQRIDYKPCNFIYKCLHHSVPSYLLSVCIRVDEIEFRRHFRSAARRDRVVLRTNTYRPRCFAVAGPSVWNSLPLAARDYDLTFPAFYTLLKTELFRRAYTAL